MNLSKKLRYGIIGVCFYSALLATGYFTMYPEIYNFERKHGLETTLKAADDWVKKYDQEWYLKPINLGKKWAVDSYIKGHKKK